MDRLAAFLPRAAKCSRWEPTGKLAPYGVIPAAEGGPAVSWVNPTTLFGAESPVWIMSGCNADGRQ